MDLLKLTKQQLLFKCSELGFIKCKSKTKKELINLINNDNINDNDNDIKNLKH